MHRMKNFFQIQQLDNKLYISIKKVCNALWVLAIHHLSCKQQANLLLLLVVNYKIVQKFSDIVLSILLRSVRLFQFLLMPQKLRYEIMSK